MPADTLGPQRDGAADTYATCVPDTAGPPPGAAPTPAAAGAAPGGPRYELKQEISRGGMGSVWRARDTELGRDVAVKCVLSDAADVADLEARLVEEARVQARLEHPNILPVHDAARLPNGRPCSVMRLMPAGNFEQTIREFHAAGGAARRGGERALRLRQYLGNFVAACNAVAYSHSQGVLHRDLKPANILLGQYGETQLADWGLALRFAAPPDGPAADPAAGEASVGTPQYMSPEQAAGAAVGPASDIYGLGATLYHLLTGRPPVTAPDAAATLERVRRGDFPRPRQVKPDVPKPLEAICLKALARDPAARYPTAQALAADVERWLADAPVAAYREGPLERLSRWRRQHRTEWRVLLLLIVVFTAGPAAYWTFRNPVDGDCLATSWRYRSPTVPWTQPQKVQPHPVDAEPALDYADFQIRTDSRHFDLSQWRPAAPPDVYEAAYATRVLRLVRRGDTPKNRALRLRYRTGGDSIALQCRSHPDRSRVELLQRREEFGKSRPVKAYDLIVNVADEPPGRAFDVVVWAIFFNGFQDGDAAGEQWAGFSLLGPSEAVDLAITFPPSRPFKITAGKGPVRYSHAPGSTEEERVDDFSFTADPGRGLLYWRMRFGEHDRPRAGHIYKIRWHW